MNSEGDRQLPVLSFSSHGFIGQEHEVFNQPVTLQLNDLLDVYGSSVFPQNYPSFREVEVHGPPLPSLIPHGTGQLGEKHEVLVRSGIDGTIPLQYSLDLLVIQPMPTPDPGSFEPMIPHLSLWAH